MGNGQIAKEHYSQFPVFSCVCLLCFVFCLLSSSYSHAEIIERVVAYVNNNAITLSEFQKNAQKTRKRLGNVSDSEIINAMINNLLLVEEAKNMRLEAPDNDELVKEYIDIKIKPAIIIREEDMERFYNENRGRFKGQDYIAVRDEIEKYLLELETNKQLKNYIEELRAKSDIKIQLKVIPSE